MKYNCRTFVLWAVLLLGAALLISCSAAKPARAQNNPPTANAEMVHSPISLYYNRPGKYQGDASAWWFRLRYHVETRVITPTQDAWTFNGVTLSWAGTRAFFPLTAMIPFSKTDSWPTGAGSGWNSQSVFSQPPGLWAVTDAFRDVGAQFIWNNNPAAPATAPWMISSTAVFTFNFTRSYLTQQPNGMYILHNDPFKIVVPVTVADSTPPIGNAGRAVPAKQAPRYASRASRTNPRGLTLVASRGGGGRVPVRGGRVDTLDPATRTTTYTQAFIDGKLSAGVLSGVNGLMSSYFASNPNCYVQGGSQQSVNIAWPENLEF